MLSISSLKPNRYCSTDASRYTNRKNILSPVFIVFQFGTGRPEGLIDWALLAFIQVSNSMPDLLIQPGVGSDPDPLKLSSTVKKKSAWLKYTFDFVQPDECLFERLLKHSEHAKSFPPILIAALLGLNLGFVWSPKPTNLSPSCDQFMPFLLLTAMYD